MRVYQPKKELDVLRGALKHLYLLGQALEHRSGATKEHLDMVEKIRKQVSEARELIEKGAL